MILLREPRGFLAVGEWYREFDQVSDDEVIALLQGVGSRTRWS